MNILSVASEAFPFVKTGGLADVTGALPKYLASLDVSTATLMPGYPPLMSRVPTTAPIASFNDVLGEQASIHRVNAEGLTLLVLDIPALFDRPGGLYLDQSGRDHADNWKRFAALSLVAAHIADGALGDWIPDVVHAHDWQAALTPVYMRMLDCGVPVVLTIHNLAFQGQFQASLFPYLGLPQEFLSIEMLEYYGDISFLKGGIMAADAITTVSPTYAREIMSPRCGMGMQGVLWERADVVRGILNGIDEDIWGPARDPYLPVTYDFRSVGRRSVSRKQLINEAGIVDDGGPIFSSVSRLTWQKGMDLLAEVADEIAHLGGALIVCGQGDKQIEDRLVAVAKTLPGKMSVHIGYEERIAHLIHGGADVLIQPSRFEPCGLTQLYALRYGNVPIVARTGGLAETVIDANDAAMGAGVATGFQFDPINSEGLRHAVRRAIEVYRSPSRWQELQRHGMTARFSWERSAKLYTDLYKTLTPPSAKTGWNVARHRRPIRKVAEFVPARMPLLTS
jgi:starch synthase